MRLPPKVFERTNEQSGVTRTERDRIMDDIDCYIAEHCGYDRARKITVTIEVEVKAEKIGERNA